MADVERMGRGALAAAWTDAADDPLTLSPEQHAAIDAHWSAALARSAGALYDAPLYTVSRIHPERGLVRLWGAYRPYRLFHAQSAGVVDVGLFPLGVSGLTLVEDAGRRWVVLGRRAADVAHYPGQWECVPSGGVSRECARPDGTLDLSGMLLQEFQEELNLPAGVVRAVQPLGLWLDVAPRTYEACFLIEAGGTRAALARAAGASAEYTALEFVAAEDAAALRGVDVIPVSRVLLDELSASR